jgi:dTDP-4-dehydrorhamnose reductase
MDQKDLKKNFVILGSKGMLGQMAKKYFGASGYSVSCLDEKFDYANRIFYSEKLRALRDTVLLNCIGKIKQKTKDPSELILANTLLPAELRNCLDEEIILVQPSTDCVFDGLRGEPYPATASADATDDYGWSKRLGEVVLAGRPNTLVPRVSIIGPDENPEGRGLLAWVRSNPAGSRIKGYTNHLWNGITTLEWCKQVEDFILRNSFFEYRLVQYGTAEYYSKFQMVGLFNEQYQLGLQIEPLATDLPVDRRLVPDIICKPLPQQLNELATQYDRL